MTSAYGPTQTFRDVRFLCRYQAHSGSHTRPDSRAGLCSHALSLSRKHHWSSNSLVGSMPAAAVNSPIDIVFEAARSAEDECDLMVAAVVAAAMRATPINPVN